MRSNVVSYVLWCRIPHPGFSDGYNSCATHFQACQNAVDPPVFNNMMGEKECLQLFQGATITMVVAELNAVQ